MPHADKILSLTRAALQKLEHARDTRRGYKPGDVDIMLENFAELDEGLTNGELDLPEDWIPEDDGEEEDEEDD